MKWSILQLYIYCTVHSVQHVCTVHWYSNKRFPYAMDGGKLNFAFLKVSG